METISRHEVAERGDSTKRPENNRCGICGSQSLTHWQMDCLPPIPIIRCDECGATRERNGPWISPESSIETEK